MSERQIIVSVEFGVHVSDNSFTKRASSRAEAFRDLDMDMRPLEAVSGYPA